jgi:O-antigen biosynthesis protein WbqV
MEKKSIKDRLKVVLRALNSSGALFRGVGGHFSHLKLNLLGVLPRSIMAPFVVLIFDVFLAFLSLFLAIYLRVGDEFLDYSPSFILKNMIVFALTSLSVFIWMQTHRTLWRYFSFEDAIPLSLSVILSTVIYFPLMILLAQQESLPRSVPFLNASVYLVMLCLPRFIYRYIYDRHFIQKKRLLAEQAVPVILAGNGDATELFIREVMHSPALSYEPLAILSPDASEKGRTIHSVPIIGTPFNFEKSLQKIEAFGKVPVAIIITDADLAADFLDALSKIAESKNLSIMKMIPNFSITPSIAAS